MTVVRLFCFQAASSQLPALWPAEAWRDFCFYLFTQTAKEKTAAPRLRN